MGLRAASPVRSSAVTLAALIAGSTALLAGGVDRADGAFPGRDGRIAFERTLENDTGGFADRIVTVKGNGEKLGGITPRCCRFDEDPSWSANGKRIAFSRNGRIFTMNRKGKKLEKLTRGKRHNGKRFEDGGPSWSPNGKQIAFYRDAGPNSDLFVIDSDGSNLQSIETSGLDEFSPAWSPDGEWIAYVAFDSTDERPEGLYRMRPDGSDVRLVLEFTRGGGPDWSPDGELLAFATRTPNFGFEIHTVRPDGTQNTMLTRQRKAAFDPAFSPRGDRIVFQAGGLGVLKLMDADGGNVKRLLRRQRGIGDFAPSWQPKPRRP